MRGNFKLFVYLFDVNPEDVSEHFQIGLIDFQSNEFLKSKFQSDEVPLKDFYKKYVSESSSFCNMVDHAKRIICMLGSTYMCEQLFLKMKFAKNKMCSRLTDDHLNGILILPTTKINVDIDKLSKNVQHKNHINMFRCHLNELSFCMGFLSSFLLQNHEVVIIALYYDFNEKPLIGRIQLFSYQ